MCMLVHVYMQDFETVRHVLVYMKVNLLSCSSHSTIMHGLFLYVVKWHVFIKHLVRARTLARGDQLTGENCSKV